MRPERLSRPEARRIAVAASGLARRPPGAFAEAHADPRGVAEPLAAELGSLAEWHGLDRVVIGERGDLAAPLAVAAAAILR